MSEGVSRKTRVRGVRALVLCALLVVAVPACTTLPDDPEERAEIKELNDPIEPFNRAIFQFNLFLDDIFFRPVAVVYDVVVPDLGKRAIHNFVSNLGEPISTINALFQGETDRASISISRFLTNSVAGMGGIADVASGSGVPEIKEDFGQTLAVYGIESGPFLMLPVLGPSNPRDAVGRVVDFFLDPVGWVRYGTDEMQMFGYATTGAELVDQRYQVLDAMDNLRETSLDFYAAIRSLYRQRREDLIRDGAPPDDYLMMSLPERSIAADPVRDVHGPAPPSRSVERRARTDRLVSGADATLFGARPGLAGAPSATDLLLAEMPRGSDGINSSEDGRP